MTLTELASVRGLSAVGESTKATWASCASWGTSKYTSSLPCLCWGRQFCSRCYAWRFGVVSTYNFCGCLIRNGNCLFLKVHFVTCDILTWLDLEETAQTFLYACLACVFLNIVLFCLPLFACMSVSRFFHAQKSVNWRNLCWTFLQHPKYNLITQLIDGFCGWKHHETTMMYV